MKTFRTAAAQGDGYFIRRKAIPDGCIPVQNVGARLTVIHSETGHSHDFVVDRIDDEPSVEMFNDKNNPLLAWIKVNRPTALEHRRPHDTHESIMFEPGIYEVRRQREYTPEGWRQVQD